MAEELWPVIRCGRQTNFRLQADIKGADYRAASGWMWCKHGLVHNIWLVTEGEKHGDLNFNNNIND
jgi:hypothetical protein